MTLTVPGPLQAALDLGVTTLARAWTVIRRDGARLGFTDHDRALEIDGVTHAPGTGLTAQAVEQATGLGIDTHSVEGALSSEAVADADLERGLYDGAEVLFWIVDWTEPANRLLEARGRLGAVRRGGHAFEAEVAGLAEAANQPEGRVFARACARRLGDAGCGVTLATPAFRGNATVLTVASEHTVTVAGLEGYASRWFDRGALAWDSGANAGGVATVKAHRARDGAVSLTLWEAPALPVAPGDALTVTAGCDKSLATCAEKFANALNFGGFPHMPGDDWAVAYPTAGEVHDGGSLFGR